LVWAIVGGCLTISFVSVVGLFFLPVAALAALAGLWWGRADSRDRATWRHHRRGRPVAARGLPAAEGAGHGLLAHRQRERVLGGIGAFVAARRVR